MSVTHEPGKSRSRRTEIRKNRPDVTHLDWQKLKADGVPVSLAIAALFFLVASGILMLRQDVVPYRPDQPIPHDIVSRVAFDYLDKGRLTELQRQRYEREPRVYQANAGRLGQLGEGPAGAAGEGGCQPRRGAAGPEGRIDQRPRHRHRAAARRQPRGAGRLRAGRDGLRQRPAPAPGAAGHP